MSEIGGERERERERERWPYTMTYRRWIVEEERDERVCVQKMGKYE
jgi:hypothetical protein